ncbi:2-dehydro-3-deoxyphosphogluconate aldolase/(4S)-4-hydroxy-2-oxoglutarate aldolase [Thermosporothrix hazakensis]|uniref:2-dehydro-3-deoxyphosphogluconate aldolase/(4S)-4-hydroxy-2-oxoglutarate aldolase n=1 Tax=Thermosporothrix hazakensis TaxID=644383 RepID=A0A326U883_THEHA|nr:bifunctional 4-hydroxy-2-oxoglutarate aldolase/2-dehydro-3-deoxy-phosphogluconate aldolase [Thermosporothrix hazakensis]PZW29395.1 2-dehydro-3-deoxyphosphogluconate aldolase/(4S)-4-hydroxy-2-oxoglutarate aldolase [Thermosporothrix hazakensis]GCE45890.1 2-dehydro-3-deoxy-phosphogluconate aldolase [Thermosporothrix hazakensis]
MTISVVEQIIQERIVAIVRLNAYTHALEVARALQAGGIPILEFTLTGKGAIEAIQTVREHQGEQVCVGVGTVLTAKDAREAIKAGAQFVVTPVVRPDVIAACKEANVPILCGALTPTEMLTAHELGADMIKLFPARQGGPQYLRDILAPLPFLRVVPTGGIGVENARAFLDAGAVAVGIGGKLISPQAVASGDWAQITAQARAQVEAIR